MNLIKFNIHNSREGILTMKKDVLTCISDQTFQKDDVILLPQYAKVINGDVLCLVVEEIQEERPSRGEWKTPPPKYF